MRSMLFALSVLAASPAVAAEKGKNLDWPVPGGTSAELHYSPATQINASNVKGLGLVWFHDIPIAISAAAEPVEVDGVLYATYGLNHVVALDAVTGKQLWTYDPESGMAAGDKLRFSWGTRGLTTRDGKVYIGTVDGRLIALDAKTGKPVWSVQTTEPNDGRYITGAPRILKDKVIIGHGGADVSPSRAYVTAYDAETGKKAWRFHIVPGDPAKGFESKAMEMAAKTWKGEWWKLGGGGTVWNAMTYDEKYNLVYLGTGNGYPWNHKIRSQGEGDNLFLCSIVALNADTGEYVWHYQVNPGESWDYNAAMDMELATLKIDGEPRDVILHAPKNGFFYVIDRKTGKVISAEKLGKVTWAERIDLATGRPVEAPNLRYTGGPFTLWPSNLGMHNWQPMSFSPKTGLTYLPLRNSANVFDDRGIDLQHWTPPPRQAPNNTVNFSFVEGDGSGQWLTAWNPVTQKKAWQISLQATAGVLTTGGDLVFQGRSDGRFFAYNALTGKDLWDFDAHVVLAGAPISFMRDGVQYISIMAGMAGTGFLYIKNTWDYRDMKRRILTFALDGKAALPPGGGPLKAVTVAKSDEKADPQKAEIGQKLYMQRCVFCHGFDADSRGAAPDLRASSIPLDRAAFLSVVRDGALRVSGMPMYEEYTPEQIDAVRHFIRKKAEEHANKQPAR